MSCFGPLVSFRYPVSWQSTRLPGGISWLDALAIFVYDHEARSVYRLVKKKRVRKDVVPLTDTRTCPARRPPLNWFLAPLFSKQKQLSNATSYRGRGGGSLIHSFRTTHAALRMRVSSTWSRGSARSANGREASRSVVCTCDIVPLN